MKNGNSKKRKKDEEVNEQGRKGGNGLRGLKRDAHAQGCPGNQNCPLWNSILRSFTQQLGMLPPDHLRPTCFDVRAERKYNGQYEPTGA